MPLQLRVLFASLPPIKVNSLGKTIEPISVLRAFLCAVHQRDAAALGLVFCEDGTYQNVPHAVVVGRASIEALFAPILKKSERVEWEMISIAVSDSCIHYERVDRFWIRGAMYLVQCHAVIEVDVERGLIRSWRDYVDSGEWRKTLGGVLDDL